MFNLRYHIASLVAVFLALAVGLILGSVVVERGVLDRQKDSIVKSLQEDFGVLSQENREMRAEVTRLRRFAEEVNPVLLDGRLEGRRVAVLVNEGRAPALAAVRDAVRAAGGEVLAVTLVSPGLGIADHRSVAVDALVGSDEETDALLGRASAMLAQEWTDGSSPRLLTDALRAARAMRMERMAPGERIDAVVLACAWDGAADPAAVGLASRLRDLGVPVAAADAGDESAVCRAASSIGLSAVDHVELPESRMPLVLLLSGDASGYYGTGPGAQQSFPSPR